MANFSLPTGEDLTTLYITDAEIIERYVGNQLWSWGFNTYGNMGDNTVVAKSSPVQTIAASLNWKQVSVGQYTTSAIKTDGTLWTWGLCQNGAAGNNINGTNYSSPVQTVAAGTNWKQVSAGLQGTAAIKTDGTLWTWGQNAVYGMLGDNTVANKSSPVQTAAGGNNWKQVAAGNTMAAIKTDGTLWTWGYSTGIGDNTATNRSSPVQTIAAGTNWKQVSVTRNTTTTHIGAVKTDGTLWMWGYNQFGQVGDSSVTTRSSPVQVTGGGTNWNSVSCGDSISAAIKSDGSLWTWGANVTYGALGDNTVNNASSPVQTVASGYNWKQVATGSFNMYAIKTDGSLWAWGYNTNGKLGNNSTTTLSSPVQIAGGGTNWKQVSGAFDFGAATTFTQS